MKIKILVSAIVGGLAITLLTGLINSTPQMLVGAVWYGYPMAWLFQMIVAPMYFPWAVSVVNLAIDAIFWSIIVGVVLLILRMVRKKSSS